MVELYGRVDGGKAYDRLLTLLDRYGDKYSTNWPSGRATLTQRDAIMITYGDQLSEQGVKPLSTLSSFCEAYLKDLISGIHVLPFFPYSSDDGFAVMDYKSVDPKLGSWDDLSHLRKHFRLMFDLVLNHISVKSQWFQAYLRAEPAYSKYFIEVERSQDLSTVVRPRALPLLTEFETSSGKKMIWTTFSRDQVDLNYHNPDVLLAMIDVILFYAAQGAEFIRLDAIAYLWKEIGTPCIHLPQTHKVVQLIRAVLDSVCPHVSIITETNVPHKENLSYFGDGMNEARLVYNFALPPLVLYTLQTGSAQKLTDWADGLELPSTETAFFNFLASHDGIGLNPARGILSEAEITAMVTRTVDNGSLVSYKQNADGSQSPYELNVSYFDALATSSDRQVTGQWVARYMVSQAIMLAMQGVPGIYFHSLFGSRGWMEGVQLTGRNRTINRQKLERLKLEQELQNRASLRSQIFTRYSRMLAVRASSYAFHPSGRQHVLDCGDGVFGLVRISPDERECVFCLHNVTNQNQTVELEWEMEPRRSFNKYVDLLTNQSGPWSDHKTSILKPYQVEWLELI